MAAWMSAARRVTNMARLSSPKLASPPQPASLIHRRHLATGEHHASRKLNFWEDPFSPSKWKGACSRVRSWMGDYCSMEATSTSLGKDKKVGEIAR